MKTARSASLVLSLLLVSGVACHEGASFRPSAAPMAHEVVRTVPAPAQAALTAPSIDACARVRANVTRVLSDAPAGAEDYPKLRPFEPDDPFSGRCLEGHGGAWAIAMTTLERERSEESTRGIGTFGNWEIVHIGVDGKTLSLAAPKEAGDTSYACAAFECVTLSEPIVYDFDGDGTDELAIFGEHSRHEAETTSFGTIWSVKNGAIVPYGPSTAFAIASVKDMTGDGRPDLLTYGEFIDTLESPCSDFPYRRMGPAFVLESLPNGTFGVGAGAKREGRKACPDTPKRLTVRASDDPKLVDEEGTFANIVCARAWGLSQTKVRSMLLSECKTPKKTPDRCDAGPGECPQMQAMLAWTKRTAPVSLK